MQTDLPARLDAQADGDDRVSLAAWRLDRVVAIGSYGRLRESRVAEVAFAVADDFRGRGVATRLLEHLTEIGVERGVDRFVAELEAGNTAMRHIFDRAGFSVRDAAPGELHVALDIPATETTPERVEEHDQGLPGCVAARGTRACAGCRPSDLGVAMTLTAESPHALARSGLEPSRFRRDEPSRRRHACPSCPALELDNREV